MANIVIVDIDGTIAKVGTRLRHLQGPVKDWDGFYDACDQDEPYTDIIDLVKILSYHYRIVFCTGRRSGVRRKTYDWLLVNYGPYTTDCKLLMRADNDYRPDYEVKPELLMKASIELSDIAFVLEDRNSMVDQWRKMGLRVLQVAPGAF